MKKSSLIFTTLLISNFLNAETIELPSITTYIDSPIVEQRQVFTSEEIQNRNIKDLPSLIEESGIQILQYGPYGLEQKPSIRGFTDETVRVVIDGVCVNNPQYGTFDFSTINIEEIEKIEIVRGGFTEGVEDESAVGGVIYITTKKQTLGHNFLTNTQLKSFLNTQTPLDTVSQKFSYSGQLTESTFFKTSIAGTYAQNKYFYKNTNNETKIREHAKVIDGNANIQLTKYYGQGNSITFNDIFYYGNKNLPGKITEVNYGTQKDINNIFTINIFNPAIKNSFNLKTNLSWINNVRKVKDFKLDSNHNLNDFKISSVAEFYKSNRIKQLFGMSFTLTKLNSTDDGNKLIFSGVLKETSKINLTNNVKITIPLSIKFSDSNYAFIPKIGFSTEFTKIEILLDFYRMVQFPTLDDLYWNSGIYKGNKNLKVETGWGSDFTINVHQVFLPFSLCFFINYYENKIQWAANNDTGIWTPQNVSSAFYFGIDFAIKKSFFNEMLNIRLNGEYLYNELLDKSNTYTYKKKIMWTPDFVGSAEIQLNLKKLNYFFSANYTGKRYLTNMNISYLKPYTLFNTGLQFNNFKHFTPYIKIENILNTKYESIKNYPMPGRSLTLGIKSNFKKQ